MFAILFGLFGRALLNKAGVHPECESKQFNLQGKRALVVSTSHGTLDPLPFPTGLFLSELTGPYYQFLDAGMTVSSCP